ncbi:MAG: hypothetical protein ACI9QD_000643, partial [Thermoproteota archaeon]
MLFLAPILWRNRKMHKKYFIVCFILSIFITSTSSAQSKNILGLDSNKDGIRDDVAKWL